MSPIVFKAMPFDFSQTWGTKDVILPPEDNIRILLFPVSAIYTLPDVSTATPFGVLSLALVPALPSPVEPTIPSPAIVVIIPDNLLTFLTRLLPESAM